MIKIVVERSEMNKYKVRIEREISEYKDIEDALKDLELIVNESIERQKSK